MLFTQEASWLQVCQVCDLCWLVSAFCQVLMSSAPVRYSCVFLELTPVYIYATLDSRGREAHLRVVYQIYPVSEFLWRRTSLNGSGFHLCHPAYHPLQYIFLVRE